jgi:2-iminobutanoate/2-iminopropanoate deaminase
MTVILHTPDGVFPPYRCYSHAVEVRGDARLLVVSGLNGYRADGVTLPESFEEQGELIWTHLGTILRSAGMDYQDLVSLRTYLADPADDEANVRLRVKYLGTHRPALTVVCCRLLDPRWKLEMEAMAAKP